MIPFFDQFVDTREKRYHFLLLCLLVSALWMVITYLVVGVTLVKVQSNSDVFDLLQTPYLEWTYVSRIIVDAISITTFTSANVMACFINNLSVFEVIMFILIVLSFTILERKRITTMVLVLLFVEVLGSCVLALVGLRSLTLLSAITYIRYIGILMIFVNLVVSVLVIYYGYHQCKGYRKALQYQVIEIKEHMDV